MVKKTLKNTYQAKDCMDFRDLFQNALQVHNVVVLALNDSSIPINALWLRLISYKNRYKTCAKCRQEKHLKNVLADIEKEKNEIKKVRMQYTFNLLTK